MTFRSFLVKYPRIYNLWAAAANFVSGIHWPRTQAVINGGLYYQLSEHDHDALRRLLKENYCLILTRRKSHLTTYFIGLMSWFATKKPAHYTHALMNVEGDITNHIDFKLIEATGKGVHYSTFMEVFDCDSVAILKPRTVSLAEWTSVLDMAKASLGAEYDLLFDLADENKVSCIELCYKAIKRLPNYQVRFANLLKLIEEKKGDLTPQMLYDCGDMDVVFEARR
jgi:hypothetical protein